MVDHPMSQILMLGINNNYPMIFSNGAYYFNKGTYICCLDLESELEVQIKVEDLVPNMLVKTYRHGYRKITYIYYKKTLNNSTTWNKNMYIMKKTKYMLDDLILTGCHSILVDTLSETQENYVRQHSLFKGVIPTIDDKKLLFSASSTLFTPLHDTNMYTLYNFVLENDGNDDIRYGIWANGVLCETPSKNYFDENLK